MLGQLPSFFYIANSKQWKTPNVFTEGILSDSVITEEIHVKRPDV
jgi:hypothetical protein